MSEANERPFLFEGATPGSLEELATTATPSSTQIIIVETTKLVVSIFYLSIDF
jgi:hypothetical protein